MVLSKGLQHGRLCNRDVFQGFAKVGLGRGGKAVRPVAEKNLVHVDFKNLILGQQMFKLEGQQNFVNFAGVTFFC